MRIIHLSDSHIGHTAYRRANAEGYNQRGEDIRTALAQAVDLIITLKPDIVMHTGDLFDSPRPLNRMIEFAYSQLLRLKEKNIPILLLAGNHETPKQKNVGHVFSLLDCLSEKAGHTEIKPGEIHSVYRGQYETRSFQDVRFHAVPHCEDQEHFEAELAKIVLVPGKKNIGVVGVKEFREAEFNEQLLSDTLFKEKSFDYTALGHLHRMVEVRKNVWYAGSTERLSFGEAAQKKGFLEIDTATGAIKPQFLPTRDMVELFVNAAGLSAADVFRKIEQALTAISPADKIIKLKVQQLDQAAYTALDFSSLRALSAAATHCELIFERVVAGTQSAEDQPVIRGLTEEFTGFCTGAAADDEQKKRLREKGLRILQEVMEE